MPRPITTTEPRRRRPFAKFVLLATAAIVSGAAVVAVLDFLSGRGSLSVPWLSGQAFKGVGSPSIAGGSADSANDSYVIFAGDPAAFSIPSGNTIETARGSGNEKTIILRSTVKQGQLVPSINTANVRIPDELAKTILGKSVFVTIWARRMGSDFKSPFAVGCVAGKGNTGWLVFNPTSEFTAFRVAYRMPAKIEGADDDRVAIWSDIDGSGQALELKSLTIDIVK
jgi:hypothetical protein